jgi:hypothetical protein
MERYGIPQALYTDHGSVYWPRKGESETLTEVGRALQTLGVKLIFANSPQAKGRKTFKGSLWNVRTAHTRIA